MENVLIGRDVIDFRSSFSNISFVSIGRYRIVDGTPLMPLHHNINFLMIVSYYYAINEKTKWFYFFDASLKYYEKNMYQIKTFSIWLRIK